MWYHGLKIEKRIGESPGTFQGILWTLHVCTCVHNNSKTMCYMNIQIDTFYYIEVDIHVVIIIIKAKGWSRSDLLLNILQVLIKEVSDLYTVHVYAIYTVYINVHNFMFNSSINKGIG